MHLKDRFQISIFIMLIQQKNKRSPDLQSGLKNAAETNLYSYRLDIDGLRGLAVIAVILFHMSKSLLPNGFRGVDVFLVISGYVVTASILRHQSKNLSDYFLNFYKRRILRLMPALLACILVTTIVGGLFIRPESFAESLNVGARALIGWSNNYLIASSSDYFGLEAELNPFTHTWSLGVEEQFYFIFPILLAAVYGLRRPAQNKRLAVLLLIPLVVASALFCLHLNTTDVAKAYYFMPSRFWQMASGALLFATLAAWPGFIALFQRQRWLSYAAQIGAVLLIGLAVTSFFPISASRGALITTLGTLLFIAAGLNQNSLLNRLVAQKPWIYLGKISYSLYLWHWPVFVLFQWTIGMDSLVKASLALCLAVAMALFSYYCIEQPVRKMKTLPYRRVFAIALIGILVVGTSTAAMAKTTLNGNLYLYKEYDKQDWFAAADKIQIVDSQISRSNCAISKDNFGSSAIEEHYKKCTYLSKTPDNPHMFLIGDSHAESLVPLISSTVEETDVGVTSLFSSACFVSLDMSYTGPACPQITRNVLDLVEKKAKANDILFIASRYAVLNMGQSINQEPNPILTRMSNQEDIPSKEAAYRQIEQELTEISKRLESKGVRIVMQAPFPEHKVHPEQCVPTWFSSGSGLRPSCFTDRALILDYRQPFINSLAVVQQQTENFYVWDAFDELCPDHVCSHFRNGKPLFLDDDHISVYGSQSLSDSFTNFLKVNKLV